MLPTALRFPEDISNRCFDIRDSRFFMFFLTMISKRLAKLSTIKYIKYDRKYEVKMTHITFKFFCFSIFCKELGRTVG